ncbi:hypothetical protein [Leptolyngbya sp. BC1307]|uniref:hypothetical protein n=1 Tax=Leptolyngbya sp. BC1307 TaxID=2029589 RepID=UPI00197F92E8|nr:hypothetical protein [Leptolyngbya sp. BC1307]
MGSLRLSKLDSDQLLDITSENLNRLSSVTFKRLCDRFNLNDPKKYWIRIVTLALSEYAYYDDGEDGFWQGVCDHLSVENSQGIQNALREVLNQGFNLLGLVQAQKKNRYVSTLWLQSGIPQQNLAQFAQLLAELSSQYDWWDINDAEPEDLSCLLYDFCQEHHPQWGKLLTFLSSSCAKDDDSVEPISGQILKGIAFVAKSLEQKGLNPVVLKDAHERERLLQNFGLSNTFFLRDWDDFVSVLTPQSNSLHRRRSIVSHRKKPLSLWLDIFDTEEIQLVLPAQTLQSSDWKVLSDTYVNIPERGWESTFSRNGKLEISEDVTSLVEQVANEWVWHLRSHSNTSLTEWCCEGTSPALPLLFFDAETGDHLSPHDGLRGITDIIVFHSRDVQIALSKGVKVEKSFVPCSIAGWRGQQIRLADEQAQLTVHGAQSTKVVPWERSQEEFLQLRGLKLKHKTPIYLEAPSVWHPSVLLPKTVSIRIENLNTRKVLTEADEQIRLKASDTWQAIELSKWIDSKGKYSVLIWNENERWHEKFELRSSFELEQSLLIDQAQAYDLDEQPLSMPIWVSSTQDFWLEELKLKNLWPLEEVIFTLESQKEKHSFTRHANSFGLLSISLASFRDDLPESGRYGLSYQRQGEDHQSLLDVSCEESMDNIVTEQRYLLPKASADELSSDKKRTSVESEPQQITYSLNIKNNTREIRKAFCTRFSNQLKKTGLTQHNIELIKDPILKDLILIKIGSQQDFTILEDTANDVASTLYTSISLIAWGKR